MKLIIFFRYVFKHFPNLVILNIFILILVGLVDSAAIISLTPVVDILIDPSMHNTSRITHRIIAGMNHFGIAATSGSLLLIFIAFNAMRSIFLIASNFYLFKTKYALLRNVILGTFDDFFKAQWNFFSGNKQGTLLNTLQREINVIGDAFGAMAALFAQIVQCLVFISVPFFISWQVSLISIVCAILFAIPLTLFGKTSYRLGQMSTTTANDIVGAIQESLQSAKLVLGFGNQRESHARLGRAFDAHRNAAIKFLTLRMSIPQVYYPLGIVVLAVTIVSGQRFAVPTAEIIVILYSFFKIIPLMADLTSQKSSMDGFFPSFEQVMNLRKQADALAQKSGLRIFSQLNHGISLSNLSFSHQGEQQVLTKLNAQIPVGKMVAFVGHSGAGKSTLIDVVMGFNEPTSGQIFIDDIPLQEYDIYSYRHRIGYVPQDSMLFNMTIRDNLTWAKEDATDEELRTACQQASADEFIDTLPKGYDTIVGDRGVRLSGGQIQRIALARAILRNPVLMILDEATSSLDSQSERLIQQSIEAISKKTTVIAIAHRLSTIVNADYIYVLENGHIAEEGTYSELVQRNGLFSQMIKLQYLEQRNDGKERSSAPGNQKERRADTNKL